MISRDQIDNFITRLQANTSGRLRAYQKAKIPTFLDISYKKVNTYFDENNTENIFNASQYTCIKVSELKFKPQIFSKMNKTYNNIPLKTLVDNNILYPFLLFINGKFIKWSSIKIIYTLTNTYLYIDDSYIAHDILNDVKILYIPFNIIYKENGPMSADDIEHIFKFGNDGLIKYDDSVLYTYISAIRPQFYWEESSSTIGYNKQISTIDSSLPIFPENFIVFKDGLLYDCNVSIDVGNIYTIDNGATGNYTLSYKLFYDMNGNYSANIINELNGLTRDKLQSYLIAKADNKPYPAWLDQLQTEFNLDPSDITINSSVWTNSVNMNSVKHAHSTVGTSNNALSTGGSGSNESFNGTTWINIINMNTNRRWYLSTVGISNNALATGGESGSSTYLNTTELFNGTIWTNSTNMNSIRYYHSTVGISNNALATGGSNSSIYLNTTELFNGSTWTNNTNMNSIRCYHSTCGISNNALATGGKPYMTLNTTELFNGNTWTNSANMNSIRYGHNVVGLSNNALATGGYTGSIILSTTEIFNGNTWANSVNMNSARMYHSTCGISNNALATGGHDGNSSINTTEIFTKTEVQFSDNIISSVLKYNPSLLKDLFINNDTSVYRSNILGEVFNKNKNNTTNEYKMIRGKKNNKDNYPLMFVNGLLYSNTSLNNSHLSINVNTNTSKMLWRMSPYLNIKRNAHSTSGNSNSSVIVIGGFDGSNKINSVEIINNGISTNSTNTSINKSNASSVGIINSALSIGGINEASILNNVEYYNGNMWSNKPNTLIARTNHISTGLTNNTFICGGYKLDDKSANVYLNTTEIFNGNTWSTGLGMLYPRYNFIGTGITNSTLVTSGNNTKSSELYNGIVWTTKANTNNFRTLGAGSGNTNNTIVCGGIENSISNISSEEYNGLIWTTSTNMNIARSELSSGGSGTGCISTAGLTVYNETSRNNTTETYKSYSIINEPLVWYNWYEMNSIRRSHSTCGISNNALVTGGYTGSSGVNTTELFNGNTWNNSTDMNSIRYGHSTVGISNNALATGGYNGSNFLNSTELFNGTTWTNNVLMSVNRKNHSTVGISNNALATGGNNGTALNTTELFNGTTWANSANMNSIRYHHSTVGISNNALATGGYNGSTSLNTTELFNGNTWTNSINMNSKRYYLSSCGISNNALATGGYNGTILNTTELGKVSYNIFIDNNDNIDILRFSDVQNKTPISKIDANEDKLFLDPDIKESSLQIFSKLANKYNKPYFVWSNTTNMNTARNSHSSCGIISSTLITGGIDNSNNKLNTTELFNNYTWTNSTNMNSIRYDHRIAGISNNALATGGYNGTILNTTELFNGTTWTNSVNMNSIRANHSTVGISNNALATGGQDSNTYLNTTELFNGTTWTNSTNMNSNRYGHSTVGISNNTLVTGGINDVYLNTTEIFNGTTWTNNINMNINRANHSSAGNSNDVLVVGGNNLDTNNSNVILNTTELFDTVSWKISTNINSPRTNHSSVGDSESSLLIGGKTDSATTVSTVEIGQYNIAYSYPVGKEPMFPLEYYKQNMNDGSLRIRFNDSNLYNKEVVFCNPNQFRYNSFTATDKDYNFKLDNTFNTCLDTSKYMVFHNGRKLLPSDYILTIFNKEKPYFEQRLYPIVNFLPGDKFDVYYLPESIIELAYNNPQLPLSGDIYLSINNTKMPFIKELFFIFINGRLIPNSNIVSIDSSTIKIINTESIEHISIIKFIEPNESISSYLGSTSTYDTMISNMTAQEIIDNMGIRNISIKNTEVDMNSIRLGEQTMWMQLTRDFYNATYGINHLGFDNTIDGSEYIVQGEDSTGVGIIHANDATLENNLNNIDRQFDK